MDMQQTPKGGTGKRRARRTPARARKPRQHLLPMRMRYGHGGSRKGAGRKPVLVDGRQRVGHSIRPALDSEDGLSITVRLLPDLPSLREPGAHRVILDALRARKDREGFRIVEFSILSNHIHLLCEGDDRVTVSRAMQGLCSSIARLLNRLWARTGKLFADRFHIDVFKVPRRAFNTLRYVLKNAWKHGVRMGNALVDAFSSGPWFTGYDNEPPATAANLRNHQRRLRSDLGDDPCSPARSWLLTRGWREAGPLHAHDLPRSP